MIRFTDVTFDYQTHAGVVHALADVTFEVALGELVCILGANGSGKSTLMRLVNGILLPTRGTVWVDGLDTRGADIVEVRRRVGMVMQDPEDQIVATTVEDDVAFGPENLGVPQADLRRIVDDSLGAVGLADLATREPHLLSGGQKQRLAIAGALAMRPAYLAFDEPSAMLDPAGRAVVAELVSRLRAQGHGILLVTHDLRDALAADRAIVLDAGRIVFRGTPGELLSESRLLDGCGLEVPPLARVAAFSPVLGGPVVSPVASAAEIAGALWR